MLKMLFLNKNKQLIVMHKSKDSLSGSADHLLQFAAGTQPLANVILGYLKSAYCPRGNNCVMVIPQDWASQTIKAKSDMIYYRENLPVPSAARSTLSARRWFIVSNGRFVTRANDSWLWKVLARLEADIVAVNVVPKLQAVSEKVLFTSRGMLAGFRRMYNDLAQPAPIPDDWPHILFISTDVLNKLLIQNALPLAFSEFINGCFSNSFTVRSLNIGGTVLDLKTEQGLLGVVTTAMRSLQYHSYHANDPSYNRRNHANSNGMISAKARIFGKVISGLNVQISENAIIVGPTVLADNSRIGEGAVVNTSIIGPGISIPNNCLVQSRILVGEQSQDELFSNCNNVAVRQLNGTRLPFVKNENADNNFRTWPRFSYARCAKRMVDIIATLAVLILSAPIFAVIALAVKLSSPGPVFFKDKRQGRHGKTFNCLKFRTMCAGADKIQDKLRVVNEVDGPQFRIQDDPRTSIVGRFLRDSYIDEIPQFINVLMGQMSIVGPRPSPESENTLCPLWRDARLSVRPGITGLWQVRRTRRSGCDFQEWIYYDTEYVRNLSLRLDLIISWQTAKEIILNLIKRL